MGTVYFVRHGAILSNRLRVYAGWSEEGLHPDGVQDAHRTGNFLRAFPIRRIFTSPLRRTKQTSEIISTHLNNAEIVVEERLKEMKLGPWEGMSEDEIAQQYSGEFKLWNSRPGKLTLEGRETLPQLQQRALAALEDLSRAGEDRFSTVAVTHVAIIRTLFLYFNNMELNDYKTIDVPNASVFAFENGTGKPKMKRIF